MIDQLIALINSVDYTNIIAGLAIDKFAKKAFSTTKRIFTEQTQGEQYIITQGLSIGGNDDEIYKQINLNIRLSKKWAESIQFREMISEKKLTDLFISLDLYLIPQSEHIDSKKEQKKNIDEILKFETSNLILLGGPGAGKTTISMYLFLLCLHGETLLSKKFHFPIVIRLRTINKIDEEYNIYMLLLETLGVDIMYHEEVIKTDQKNNNNKIDVLSKRKEIYRRIVKRVALELIEELRVLIILDGFDEISDTSFAERLFYDLEDLSLYLDNSRFILTSRTGAYRKEVKNAKTLQICPLSDEQIEGFIYKWLDDVDSGKELYQQIRDSPFYDTAIRPINIAHLCAIYDRYGFIDDTPKSIYKKIVYILLEKWDLERGIERVSKYATKFRAERKLEFLSVLAFVLAKRTNNLIFNKDALRLSYQSICDDFRLPVHEVDHVINELETHTGLFIQSGFDQYEFSHKSLHEYLTADYIVKLDSINAIEKADLLRLGDELAIYISLTSNPSTAFENLVYVIGNEYDIYLEAFYNKFISRLALEKPDFSASMIFALSVVGIYNLMSGEARLNTSTVTANYDDDRYRPFTDKQKKEQELKSFNENFNVFLLSHPNINRSFRMLSHFYNIIYDGANYYITQTKQLESKQKFITKKIKINSTIESFMKI